MTLRGLQGVRHRLICLIGLGFRFATIGFGLATMTKIVTSGYPLLDEMIRRNIPLTRENYIRRLQSPQCQQRRGLQGAPSCRTCLAHKKVALRMGRASGTVTKRDRSPAHHHSSSRAGRAGVIIVSIFQLQLVLLAVECQRGVEELEARIT